MAIAFDQTTTAQQLAGSSLSFSASTSGSNRILLVPVFTSYGTSGDKISGVTYNGVSMTRVTGATQIDFVSGQSFYLYYLIAPATGTNTVLITATGSGEIYGTTVSYTGVDQTSPIDNSTTTTSGGTITLTTVADNCWTLSFGRNTATGALTASTGTTQRSAGSGLYNIGDSNGAITPVGSTSMSWTPDNANTKLCMISFAPSTGSTTTNHNLTLLGVGA